MVAAEEFVGELGEIDPSEEFVDVVAGANSGGMKGLVRHHQRMRRIAAEFEASQAAVYGNVMPFAGALASGLAVILSLASAAALADAGGR